ncbi:MAG: helix-turn-helix transcriptional regulator [Planctomycetia bacterium]|jgi:putative transcriptional regulator
MKNNVERTREARGMSQSDLAKAAGVSRQSIHALERGAHEPRLSLAYRVADALGATLESVFPAPQKAPAKKPAAKKTAKKAAKKAGRR